MRHWYEALVAGNCHWLLPIAIAIGMRLVIWLLRVAGWLATLLGLHLGFVWPWLVMLLGFVS